MCSFKLRILSIFSFAYQTRFDSQKPQNWHAILREMVMVTPILDPQHLSLLLRKPVRSTKWSCNYRLL